ncbi:Vps62-related protein [Myxococcus stipitatus]|uniref:Vps62-related protein n=1 Tax=Myxococcus stipitatus TaxID=83455 RepID=UPI001F3A693E|nr:Vps62-related protein [Myxococcus stipitatus]MCE9673220.1 Vps62-related protein [Myxococcus stipitatus]
MSHPWQSTTSRKDSGRGVVLAGLVALSSACQPGPTSGEPTPPESPSESTQSLAALPKTCQDVKNQQYLTKDGEYLLYYEGERSKPWKAYCHGMAGTPVEYLTLPESHLFSNFSEYAAGDHSPGTTVRTIFHKLRIDPTTLRVRAWDKTFTTSTGQLTHGPTGATVTVMPYATAMACTGGDSGRATVDLRGTPFILPYAPFHVDGWARAGTTTREPGDQVATLTGGGACGWNGPTLTAWEDPLDGGILPLIYDVAAPTWKVAARVYPVGGSPTSGQALDLGWYDMHQLTVGNDAINAVRVPRGWKVTLYTDSGFRGTQHIFTRDTDLTGHVVNLQTSSIHVEAPVTVFTQPSFTGESRELRPGRYTLEQLGLTSATFRSLRIPEGFRVTLHEESFDYGRYQVLTQDTDLATGSYMDGRVAALFIESPSQRDTNVVYGHWQSSGGREVRHDGNRRLLLSGLGVEDEIVTIDLESAAGPVLFLSNGTDTPVAESVLISPTVARLTVAMRSTEGPPILIAGTSQPGKSGAFTVRANRGRLQYASYLEAKVVTGFHFIYDDRGTGAAGNLSVWRPAADNAQGYYSLGDVAMPSHGVAPRAGFVVKDKGYGGLLLRPKDYALVWSSEGTSGGLKGSFWQALPFDGYTCLGGIANNDFYKPPLDAMRCVRSDFAVQVASQRVWDDAGAKGSKSSVTLLETRSDAPQGLYTSTLNPVAGRYLPGMLLPPVWALNRSALDNPEFRGGFVDDYAVIQFAPRVWLHSDEQFLPSTTEYFLKHVKEVNGHLTTLQPLGPPGCDECADPPFLRGLHPSQTHVPVYAQLIPRTVAGTPTNITDVIYWTFYDFNLGKHVCIGGRIGDTCLGYWMQLGNHVGDWEHLTVRFVDGRPTQVTMSQHGKAPIFGYGGKHLPMMGLHPEAYSALGSHGLYPDAAVHEYMNLYNGDSLKDVTNRGTAWHTWDKPVVFPWQPQGTFKGSLSWLNITAGWGNAKSGCDNAVSRASGECILNGGPGGPMQKDFTHPDYGELE